MSGVKQDRTMLPYIADKEVIRISPEKDFHGPRESRTRKSETRESDIDVPETADFRFEGHSWRDKAEYDIIESEGQTESINSMRLPQSSEDEEFRDLREKLTRAKDVKLRGKCSQYGTHEHCEVKSYPREGSSSPVHINKGYEGKDIPRETSRQKGENITTGAPTWDQEAVERKVTTDSRYGTSRREEYLTNGSRCGTQRERDYFTSGAHCGARNEEDVFTTGALRRTRRETFTSGAESGARENFTVS